jgi:nucleoid DNA-binding protein
VSNSGLRKRRKKAVPKAALDAHVAALLGQKQRDISLITTTFLKAIAGELADMNMVHLDGLGELEVYARSGKRLELLTRGTFGRTETAQRHIVAVDKKYYVSFRKAAPLSKAIQVRQGKAGKVKKVMDKLGVDEEQAENEKLAQHGCPLCGAKVERHGSVLVCPRHGSEPFESKTPKK